MDRTKREMSKRTLRIEAEDVCVDYNGTVALYDANLSLPAGSICGLVGMNGAGKSTFVRSIPETKLTAAIVNVPVISPTTK